MGLEPNYPEVTAQLHLLWNFCEQSFLLFLPLKQFSVFTLLTATVKTLGQSTVIPYESPPRAPKPAPCSPMPSTLSGEVLAVEHTSLMTAPCCAVTGVAFPCSEDKNHTFEVLMEALHDLVWADPLLISLSYFPLFSLLASWNCLTSFSHQWLLYFWSF